MLVSCQVLRKFTLLLGLKLMNFQEGNCSLPQILVLSFQPVYPRVIDSKLRGALSLQFGYQPVELVKVRVRGVGLVSNILC